MFGEPVIIWDAAARAVPERVTKKVLYSFSTAFSKDLFSYFNLEKDYRRRALLIMVILPILNGCYYCNACLTACTKPLIIAKSSSRNRGTDLGTFAGEGWGGVTSHLISNFGSRQHPTALSDDHLEVSIL